MVLAGSADTRPSRGRPRCCGCTGGRLPRRGAATMRPRLAGQPAADICEELRTSRTTIRPGRTVPSGSSPLPKPIPGDPDRSTSPSTRSAGSRSSADSPTSTASPPDHPRAATETQVTTPNRISEPHRVTSSRSPWRRAFGITPSRATSSARSAQVRCGRLLTPLQDGELVAQDQDLCGLPCLLTPGQPQPRGHPRDEKEGEPQAHDR